MRLHISELLKSGRLFRHARRRSESCQHVIDASPADAMLATAAGAKRSEPGAATIKCWNSAKELNEAKRGGAEEDRTPDLLRARQALSQLSYGPFELARNGACETGIHAAERWWVWVDLNHRPHPYQGCALTN